MAARETQTENTKVVHCTCGTHDVYIGGPSKWGNPFVIGKDGTRERVIQQYRNWLMTQPSLLAALPELRGRTLGCWCSPAACHGDVLAELADAGLSQRSLSATATPRTRQYGGKPDFPSHESGVKGIQKDSCMHDKGRDQTEERKAKNGSVACNARENFVSASVRIGRKERGAAATRTAARPMRRVRTPRVTPGSHSFHSIPLDRLNLLKYTDA